MKKIILLLCIGVGLMASDALAQRKAGRNAAAFLEVGVGAREVALGSAVTTMAYDANMLFWNPAGTALAQDQTLSASFSYNKWIADINYSAAAVSYNTGNTGTVSFGVQMFGLSDIKANRQNGYTDPFLSSLVTDPNTSETYDYMDLAFSAAYSKYITENLSLGATAKFVNQRIDDVSGTAFAFDFGSIYHVGVKDWTIGARLNNLGSKVQFYNQKNPLPLTFAVGSSIYPVSNETMRRMVAVDAVKPMDSQQLVFGGAELSFYDLVFLRGGYKYNYSGNDDGGNSQRTAINTSIEGLSFGGGIQHSMNGFNIAIDYAYTQMDLLDNTHRITLKIRK